MQREALNRTIELVESWLDYYFPRSGMPGLSLAVRDGDGFLYSKSWGVADIESGEVLTPDHIFRMASHSKMFTAVAVALLHDRGQLCFDDPVGKHLPWIREEKELAAITIRQLLQHKSKLPRDGSMGDFWNFAAEFPDDDAFKAQTLKITPVKKRIRGIKYSNWGYGLLGKVIEAVSGRTLESFVAENIMAPLELGNSAAEYSRLPAENKIVSGHGQAVNNIRPRFNAAADTGALAAATGIYSTPADMSLFLLEWNSLLKQKTAKELCSRFNEVVRAPGEFYAMGFNKYKLGRHSLIGHLGGYPGQLSASYHSSAHDLAISVTTNAEDALSSPYPVLETIFKSFLFHSKNEDAPRSPFEGRYQNLRSCCYVLPYGDDLKILEFDSDKPWKSPSDAKRKDASRYRIYGDSGFGIEGEDVVFEKVAGSQIMKCAGVTFKRS